MPAPWAADDPVGRAERPPHTIRQARDHPQHAEARRAALPAKAAPPSCTNRRTAEYSTQHTPAARAQHTQTRTRIQHAHAHSTRASHASAALHTEHTPHQQQQACHNAHNARTATMRAHALPPTGARIGRRREQPSIPKLTCVAACAACP